MEVGSVINSLTIKIFKTKERQVIKAHKRIVKALRVLTNLLDLVQEQVVLLKVVAFLAHRVEVAAQVAHHLLVVQVLHPVQEDEKCYM